MLELKIYLDRERNKPVEDEIVFEPVVAGEVSKKSIFVENIIDYPVAVELNLEGEDVNITKDIKSIQPGILEELEFEFTPQLTTMAPIRAKLNIKLNYVVR